MPCIYEIDKDKQIVLVREAIMLCPELNKLSPEEIKYIIIAYDYVDGPCKKMANSERRNFAINKLFNGKDQNLEAKPYIRSAIDEYQSLIYHTKKHTVDTLNSKIFQLNQELANPDLTDSTKIANIDKSITILEKRKDAYEQEIASDQDLMQLKGGKRKMSLLETMKVNRDLYKINKRHVSSDNIQPTNQEEGVQSESDTW
jgi:hypothetical protein